MYLFDVTGSFVNVEASHSLGLVFCDAHSSWSRWAKDRGPCFKEIHTAMAEIIGKKCTSGLIHSSSIWWNIAHHVLSNDEDNPLYTWRTSVTQSSLYPNVEYRCCSVKFLYVIAGPSTWLCYHLCRVNMSWYCDSCSGAKSSHLC